MNVKKLILLLISVVLVCSALLKLFSVTYVSNILFLLLPDSLLPTFFAANLKIFVIVICAIELLLGLLLWTPYSQEALYIICGYLVLMLALNAYQLYTGVKGVPALAAGYKFRLL